MYEKGKSLYEIAEDVGKSYTFARNRVIGSGTRLRSKSEAMKLLIDRRPEWSNQFVKYHVQNPQEMTDDKIALLTMILTEGYFDRTSFGFTNSQDDIHARFARLVKTVYGEVSIGRNRILSRVSSTEIAKDLAINLPGKTFSEHIFRRITSSEKLSAEVLRIIADTEGSMIISLRKAPRNFTVEARIVLASSNLQFSQQIKEILRRLGIDSRETGEGVIIGRKVDMIRFIQSSGFSEGVRVVRKKAGSSNWYGLDKATLAKLYVRIVGEQKEARTKGERGCFESCKTREELVKILLRWYGEEGGESA